MVIPDTTTNPPARPNDGSRTPAVTPRPPLATWGPVSSEGDELRWSMLS